MCFFMWKEVDIFLISKQVVFNKPLSVAQVLQQKMQISTIKTDFLDGNYILYMLGHAANRVICARTVSLVLGNGGLWNSFLPKTSTEQPAKNGIAVNNWQQRGGHNTHILYLWQLLCILNYHCMNRNCSLFSFRTQINILLQFCSPLATVEIRWAFLLTCGTLCLQTFVTLGTWKLSDKPSELTIIRRAY